MPTDYYPQLTDPGNQPDGENQLLAYLDALQKRATIGAISAGAAVGTQTTRSFAGGARPEVEIRRIRWSLFLIDPQRYADPYSERIRRTRSWYIYS